MEQCICKPVCNCPANPNYAWAIGLKQAQIKLEKERREQAVLDAEQKTQQLINAVKKQIETAIQKQESEIRLTGWYVDDHALKRLSQTAFVHLTQIGQSERYKFKFLV